MSKALPEIPGSFPKLLSDAMISDIDCALADFRQNDDPNILKKYEREFTAKLKAAVPGDDFLGQKVTRVNAAADTATLEARISGRDVPFVPGLKVGLATAEIEITRRINLSDVAPDRPPVDVKNVVSFAIEFQFAKKKNYEIRLGYKQDDSAANQSQMALVSVKWDSPKFNLFGFLGQTNKGGLLIEVKGESPVAIPLGPTGFGLKGIGLLYGEHFAPILEGANPDNAMQRLASADAGAYADWAQSARNLTTWSAVPDDINVYGINAVLADMVTGGTLARIQDLGLVYVTYGQTLIFSGEIRLLDKIDGGTTVGVIDLRSQSFFARNTQRYDVIPWAEGAMVAEGSLEFSASLINQDRTYLAIGGYGMDGCRVRLLDLLELSGGVRLLPSQGFAANARGRIAADGTICGFGGGYSLWFNIQGGLGWNPAALEAKLDIGGSLWIEALGKKLGLSASLTTELYLKKPFIFKMSVDFEASFWFVTVHLPVKIFEYDEREPATPEPTLKHAADAPLATMHPPSGQVSQLDPKQSSVWPDTMFVLDFQRSAGGSSIVVNPVTGHVREAGVDVQHQFSRLGLAVERRDPDTGTWAAVADIRASWLLNNADGATTTSSRLAIPCTDPLGWMQRFDYAQPPTSARRKIFRLQTFGVGQSRAYMPGTGAPAMASFEDVKISAKQQFWLIAVPWAEIYRRALNVQSFEVSFSTPIATGSRAPVAVAACELRILAPRVRPPKLSIQNGTAGPALFLRSIGGNQGEWLVPIERKPDEELLSLLVTSEEQNLVAAVGYLVRDTVESKVPDTHVMAPGHYRLVVDGESSANFRGTAAASASKWAVNREFDVELPPLRPYLRYATLGDERVFGLQAGGWNPNPAGQGFGHYPDHLGQLRFSVAYLARIYSSLSVQTDDKSDAISIEVDKCMQGTLAGSMATTEWRVETGQPSAVEDELSFTVGQSAGFHQLTVRRTEAEVNKVGDIIDQWTYRVSRFASPSKHLTTEHRLGRAISPFGSRELPATVPPAIPAKLDIDALPPAKIAAGWTLPKSVASLAGVENPEAGLSFLCLLEWCGIFNAPLLPIADGPLHRPYPSDLCLVADRAPAPVALLMRTSEPCDWRRVEIVAVTGYADAAARRFVVRPLPSPDGCQCLMVLEADGVPVRVPKGDLLLRIRFKLEAERLPRLTLEAYPTRTFEEIVTTFVQPTGTIWWET